MHKHLQQLLTCYYINCIQIWLQSTIATELWELVFGRLLAYHQTLQEWTKILPAFCYESHNGTASNTYTTWLFMLWLLVAQSQWALHWRRFSVAPNVVCYSLSGTPINSQSLSIIVISATAGLRATCCSTSPGRVVRLRKKFSTFSAIIWLLVIATKKHCRRCVFENGPTSWPMIAVKSLLPGRNKPVKFNVLMNTSVVCWSLIPTW